MNEPFLEADTTAKYIRIDEQIRLIAVKSGLESHTQLAPEWEWSQVESAGTVGVKSHGFAIIEKGSRSLKVGWLDSDVELLEKAIGLPCIVKTDGEPVKRNFAPAWLGEMLGGEENAE